mmetsp:Transcript_73123/g.145031  ORF Transcript_73123/g.145031 Transcript_73123/m.145031 type:complete len:110 (+) Transcript_73123:66-395(+)
MVVPTNAWLRYASKANDCPDTTLAPQHRNISTGGLLSYSAFFRRCKMLMNSDWHHQQRIASDTLEAPGMTTGPWCRLLGTPGASHQCEEGEVARTPKTHIALPAIDRLR